MEVGAACHVDGRRRAVVRFMGKTSFADGEWVGVELARRGSGRNDGSVQGVRYFDCAVNTGLFVRPGRITVDESTAASSKIQSVARARQGRKNYRNQQAVKSWNVIENADEQDHLYQTNRAMTGVDNHLRRNHGGGRQQGAESASGGLGEQPLVNDPSYKGPHITFPVTRLQALEVLAHFKRHPDEPLHTVYAEIVLSSFRDLMRREVPTAVVHVPIPENGKVRLVGDTHGQFQDFLFILMRHGLPSSSNVYMVNGDIADRGPHAAEIFLILCIFKLADPGSVFINRGNHENAEMNRRDVTYGGGFYHEVRRKFGGRMFHRFQECFNTLSLATVIG